MCKRRQKSGNISIFRYPLWNNGCPHRPKIDKNGDGKGDQPDAQVIDPSEKIKKYEVGMQKKFQQRSSKNNEDLTKISQNVKKMYD
jgi:hypothetical protein